MEQRSRPGRGPGGWHEAAAAGARFTRAWTHGHALVVQALRNRAAHHEPLVTGIPLPGRGQSARPRVSVEEGISTCALLLRMVDRDLAEWVAGESRVPGLLAAAP